MELLQRNETSSLAFWKVLFDRILLALVPSARTRIAERNALNQAVQTQTVLVMVQKLKNLAMLLAKRFMNGIRSFGNHIHCDDFIQQIQ